MAVSFLPSQIGSESDTPLEYTSTPTKLIWSDVQLFFSLFFSVFGILRPLSPHGSGELDEIHPSRGNLICLGLHFLLIVAQLAFIISLPFFFLFPFWAFVGYFAAFVILNREFCRIINGPDAVLKSSKQVVWKPEHQREHWVFLNGVSVGKHWLQSNIDRLSLTFGRRIVGVANPSSGIIFDIIQCLIQRNFCYATQDVRNAYAEIKSYLMAEEYEKVVFILHSQGGIMGGLVIDWLLDEVPQDQLQKLEVYTFGNAANHFNNPHRTLSALKDDCRKKRLNHGGKAIKHIEHYANDGDFVAKWGVLHFAKIKNRFMGRVFQQSKSGHLLNQHYLDTMFPLDATMRGCAETNDFMESDITIASDESVTTENNSVRESILAEVFGSTDGEPRDVVVSDNIPIKETTTKVRELSRLWLYRNGRTPPELGRRAHTL